MRMITYKHHFVTPDLLTKDFTQPESIIINEKQFRIREWLENSKNK